MKSENEAWVDEQTGLTLCDKHLAFKYLCKGFGLHKIADEDLQWGWSYARVHTFIPLGRQFDLQKEGRLWDENHEDWEHAGSTESREEYLARLHERNANAENEMWVDVHLSTDDPADKSTCGCGCHYEFHIECSGHGGPPSGGKATNR